jgi:integrase
MVKAVRDDYAATPRKAHKVKQMMSRLYSWAGEADIVADGVNPAQRLRRLKRQGGEREITVWSEAEIGLFLAHCPPHIETAVLLGLYTGQRSSDVCRMTWGQYLGGAIRVRQSKTGALLEIPCHPVLRAHLEALKAKGTNSLTIVTGTTGRPSNPNQLSTAINRACAAIVGMPARSFHGLRYAAGSMLEEAGCTIGEIEAVLGHNTLKMAMKYATQRLRAKAALARVEEQEQNKKLQTRSEKVQTRVDK